MKGYTVLKKRIISRSTGKPKLWCFSVHHGNGKKTQWDTFLSRQGRNKAIVRFKKANKKVTVVLAKDTYGS